MRIISKQKAALIHKDEKYLTTAHERDAETDLDYRGARFYDSDVVRFLSLDPHQSKYPTLSPYNYVACNPNLIVDSDGKDNTLYIVALGLTENQVKGFIAKANTYLRDMGLKTEVVLYTGQTSPTLYVTDAVMVVGNNRDIIGDYVLKNGVQIGTNMQMEMKGDGEGTWRNHSSFDVFKNYTSSYPEVSDYDSYYTVMDYNDAILAAQKSGNTATDFMAYTIAHAMGHISGIDKHPASETGCNLMESGGRVQDKKFKAKSLVYTHNNCDDKYDLAGEDSEKITIYARLSRKFYGNPNQRGNSVKKYREETNRGKTNVTESSLGGRPASEE